MYSKYSNALNYRGLRTERATPGEIGQRLGRKALEEAATAARPEAILGWYRRPTARRFDGSKRRPLLGRSRVDHHIEGLVVRLARENPSWGCDRIVGALVNLGTTVADQTVGSILHRHGIPPAPKRGYATTWKDFIRVHLEGVAGTDCFTVQVVTLLTDQTSWLSHGSIRWRRSPWDRRGVQACPPSVNGRSQ